VKREVYTTPEKVRQFIHIPEDYLSTKIAELIKHATEVSIDYITASIIDEKLLGEINNVNRQFLTYNKPIADVTGDWLVDGNDVKVKL